MEEVNVCPVCGGTTFKTVLAAKDHLVSQQTFQIQQCQQCQLLLTNPRPDAGTIGNYYQSDSYISHDDTKQGVIDRVYKLVRTHTLQQKEKLIRRLNGRVGTLLDYGCGTGAFLEECGRHQWQLIGYEPDQDARGIAEKRTQTTILKDVNELTNIGQVDVVTMWHVLEHVAEPNQILQSLSQVLRKGGVLVIAVPNPDSADASLYKEQWAAYDVPRHLYHFKPDVLKQLLNQNGFQFEEQLPMVFDAYYIAMLSTRHRDGKTNYAESLWSGFKSNNAAGKTGNYSSLTYVFRKR